MKLSFLNGWIFCVSFFLLSCSSAEGENTSEEKMTSSTKSDSGKGENIASCLGKFDYDYSKLLTSEYVLKHVSLVNSADLEQKYDADAVKRYPEYGEIYYNWPSGRPDVQMNPSFPLKTPDDNSISLTNLSFEEGNLSSIRERFKTSYKVMSEEEIAEGMARL